MQIRELADNLSAKIVVDAEGVDVNDFYAGDFLSRVIGKAPAKSAWFTIMNNVNVAGVASLAEISVIVLCEGVEPVSVLIEKCKENGIALLVTSLDVYSACVKARG